MDNPEEVLQALDEFQKLRPSEIPRELEDYLSWVARTGDPVYQWSLIKALFREKLARVMTDFYETCPSLDLTPCPNVEQFNYDLMKSSLLERLESFASAPFTVQRICELLVTPRKEYNRIDKFMRAIEKNILVVSTREPGLPPYGQRRSENGDSLVNGSVEDEGSHHESSQTSNEVEMESWVKDCTATAVLPVVMHNEDVSNGLKTVFGKADDKDSTPVSFVQEFPQVQPVIQQEVAATNHHEVQAPAVVVGDVAEAIMNEDTSSQPSLELESSGDDDSSEAKKLQTTFQAKDFAEKLPKTYSEALKGEKVAEEEAEEESAETAVVEKESEQVVEDTYTSEKLESNVADVESADKTDSLDADVAEASVAASETVVEKTVVVETEVSEKSEPEAEIATPIANDVDLKKDDVVEDNVAEPVETVVEKICDTEVKEEPKVEPVVKEIAEEVVEPVEETAKEVPKEVEVETPSEVIIKPIVVEEPIVEKPSIESTPTVESKELTIEASPTKTVVPDPVPIVEEPKEAEPLVENSPAIVVTEIPSEIPDEPTVKNGTVESPVTPEDSQMIVSTCEEAPTPIDKLTATAAVAAESMDVDGEAVVVTSAAAVQDEPMEEESVEPMNS